MPAHRRARASSTSGPGERAVALDRGAGDPADAGGAAAIDGIQDVEGRAPLPAVHGDRAVADVDRHDELFAVGRRVPLERAVVGKRCGADHDAPGSRGEQRLGVCERADASCRLDGDRLDRGHDGLDERRVDPTRAGGTEVDEMDQLRATRRELSRERERVGAPRDDAVERAALEPNGFSLEHVECWNDRESILSN